MKKFYFIFSILFLVPIVSFATSGACSSHGGVNCSAGAGSGGYSICNDGWTSSTSYSNTDECSASCTPPSSSGCKSESDYGAKQVQLNAQGGYLGGNASQEGVLQQCRNEIDSYQSAFQLYNTCLSKGSSSSSPLSYSGSSYSSGSSSSSFNSFARKYCIENYGDNSKYDSSKETCVCNNGYYSDPMENNICISDQKYCDNRQGINSHWDAPINKCTCNEGFVIDKAKNELCVPIDDWCAENMGPNYYGKDNVCVLKEETPREKTIAPIKTKTTVSELKKIKPEVEKIISKEVINTEEKEIINNDTLITPPQTQNQPEIKPVQKQSIFKKSWKWIIGLFN